MLVHVRIAIEHKDGFLPQVSHKRSPLCMRYLWAVLVLLAGFSHPNLLSLSEIFSNTGLEFSIGGVAL